MSVKVKIEDTKGVIRTRKSQKDGTYHDQNIDDAKGVFRNRQSKKDRQHWPKDKEQKDNDLSNIYQPVLR